MTERFTGTVKPLCQVGVARLVEWIDDIPFDEWPQQGRLPDGRIRPSMVTDLEWHGFGLEAAPLVGMVLASFPPSAKAYQRMLSVVMPGHHIDPHKDGQPDYWLARVHVPLKSNPHSSFIVEGSAYTMVPGFAYLVNTTRVHAVTNDGMSPRIHFMFDVRAA